jgi:hypothetical protein
MDWASHDHRARARIAPGSPTLVHTYWRVVGPSQKAITCALYRTPAGHWEVRAGYSVDDVIRSQIVRTREAGEDVAAIWKMASLEKGFTDVDAGPPHGRPA